MKIRVLYDDYKETESDRIIIMKEGSFYKSVGDDAIILWHLFDYKIINDNIIGFPLGTLNKVLNVLAENSINYIVVDEEKEMRFTINNYHNVLAVASSRYERFMKKDSLIRLVNDAIFSDLNKYDEIMDFISDLQNS